MKQFITLLALTVIIATSISVTACNSKASVPDEPSGNTSISQGQSAKPSDSMSGSQAQSAELPDRVDIVFFYRTNPCACMKVVGDYIQQVVILDFQEQVDEGKLTLKMVTSDNPNNDALVKKFQSPPFWLYIVEVHGETETIHSVPGIWGLTGDTAKLAAYIKDQIQKALDGTL